MKPEESATYEIGARVDVSGDKGTVRYIGKVLNTDGLWLGIDWDSPERGKHDGTQVGVRYFTASHPTSGSFIRPKKVSPGITVLEAIQNRYGRGTDGTDGLDYDKIAEVQRDMGAKVFEVVGTEELNDLLSDFKNLYTVVLHGFPITSAGHPMELLQMCPNIRELHLGKTLLSSWQTVMEIVSQLKYLHTLNVSSNRLKITNDMDEESFSSLRHLVMGSMTYTWYDVLRCCEFILNLETLQVPFNNIHVLRKPPSDLLTQLTSLDLEGNELESWSEVNKLGRMTTLKSMNLRNCGLKEIHFPVRHESEWSTYLFVNLEALALSNNLLDDWVYVSELDKLESLVDLKLKDNPILEREKMETNHEFIIAKIRKLEKINGADILYEDRRGSEVDYHKRYGLEWIAIKGDEERLEFLRKHPCYPRLIEKFGPPDKDELQKPKTSLKSQLIEIELYSEKEDGSNRGKSFRRKVPYNMSVQKLTGLTQRLFNTGNEMPRLFCFRCQGEEVLKLPMDNELRQLNYYSVGNGDKIAVLW